MNDTKWSRVCFGFDAWPSQPRFRICDLGVGAEADLVTDWLSDFPHNMLPFVRIRWLDVELPDDEVPSALAMCERHGAAVNVIPGGIRVWGWIAAGEGPPAA